MRSLLVVLALLAAIAPSLHGEVLYLLADSQQGQGIYRLDTETGAPAVPFAQFIYWGGMYGPAGWGKLRLTTSAGLVHLQGRRIHVFDERTGQFLRRYEALGRGWGFSGVGVDLALAGEFGIEPGYYGLLRCGYDYDGVCRVEGLPGGYPETAPRPSSNNVLLRRGWAPEDMSLDLVSLLTAGSPNAARVFALDRATGQLLVLSQEQPGMEVLQTLSAIDLADGSQTLLREWSTHIYSGDPWYASAMAASRDGNGLFLLVRRKNETSIERHQIDGTQTKLFPGDGISDLTTASDETTSVHQQLFPIVGETSGVNGTYWRSDAWFFNPSTTPMTVRLRLLSDPELSAELILAPHESQEMLNILRTLRSADSANGTDAVIIESDAREGAQLSAYSRTYTAEEGGGTYGQMVPAVPLSAGYSNHVSELANWRDLEETVPRPPTDRQNPGQYRHNFGVTNTTSEPVEFKFGDEEIVIATLTVPPHTVRQVALETIMPATYGWSSAIAGSAPVPVWMSMVDNITGDASFIPFSLYAIESGPGANLTIPAIIRSEGANGTSWRTDAYGVFWDLFKGERWRNPPYVTWRGPTGCTRLETSLTSSPSSTVYADIVGQLCGEGSTKSGALEVRTGSWTSMVSRTYTTREDGGTYGDILPLYPPRGWPERHFAGVRVNEQFRVNVGLYNGTATAATQRLELYRADGSLAGTKEVQLAPYGAPQTPLSGRFAAGDGVYGLSVHSDSGVWPWVSVVDNRTGDPTNLW